MLQEIHVGRRRSLLQSWLAIPSLGVALLGIVCGPLAMPLGADEGAEELPLDEAWREQVSERELKRRARDLRNRARRWWTKRKALVGICQTCKGRGEIQQIASRRARMVNCPTCHGLKFQVTTREWNLLFWDFMSPEYRAQRGQAQRVASALQSAKRGSGTPGDVERYRFKSIDMIGPRHGIVTAEVNRNRQLVSQYWVLMPKERGDDDLEWFTWDSAEVDGYFPSVEQVEALQAARAAQAEAEEAAEAEQAAREVEGLELERLRALDKVVGPSVPGFKMQNALESNHGRHLIVKIMPAAAGQRPEVYWRRYSVAALRALHEATEADQGYEKVELWWQDRFKDTLGRVAWLPIQKVGLTAAVAKQAVWENLDADERVALLSREQPAAVDGYTRWPLD